MPALSIPKPVESFARNLAYLQMEARLLRLHLALKAGFNHNQPRVAAGNPDGGQWTSTGTSSGGIYRSTASQNRSRGQSRGAATGRRNPPRSISEQTVVNRDGSAIRSEVSTSLATTGWTERHTVVGADGAIRTFQNDGLKQSVFDDQGRRLSESVWTERGPEQQAIVQPAFLPLVVEGAAATVELGLTLYTWLSTRDGPDQQAVVAFSAREFVPSATPSIGLDYVGLLPRDKVDAACPRLGEVQAHTDDAVESVRRLGAIDPFPAAFGTAVHLNLKRQINALGDPDFKAEVSALKTLDETYGTKDSIRVDVFENVGDGTVCVYDIKTGKQGLSRARAAEIANKVFRSYAANRFIVIETRPTQ